jgi:hypothetical protein
MTSRERVLAAVRRETVDHVPGAPLMNFQPEDQRWGRRWRYPFGPSDREMPKYMVGEVGVDQLLQTEIGFAPERGVTSRVWMEGDVIHKNWTTSSDILHAAVRFDEHWVPGFDIPLFHGCNPSH